MVLGWPDGSATTLKAKSSTVSPSTSSPLPQTGDASFGLDPYADVQHHIEGHRWLPEFDWMAPRLSASHTHAGPSSLRATSSRSRRSRPGATRAASRHKSFLGRSDDELQRHSTNEKSREDSAEAISRPGTMPIRPPTGSLTLSIFSPGIPLARRFSLLASSIIINAALPFINGIMLGTGEIVARAVLVPVILIGCTWIRKRSGE